MGKAPSATVSQLLALAVTVTHPFPPLLRQVNRLPYHWRNGGGVDFRPFDEFVCPAETQAWIQNWTGNQALTGEQFLFFGRDSTGGYSGIWQAIAGADVLDQPIIFLGSDGDAAVIAKNFSDYLWLLAYCHTGCEVCTFVQDDMAPDPVFLTFAEKHASTERRLPSAIVAEANALHPDFEGYIERLCGR